MDIEHRANIAEITGVSLLTDEIEPGTRPALVVTLRPFNGPEYSRSIPIDIPLALAGATLKIEAAAGNLVKPDLAQPESVGAMLANLTKEYPARAIVVSVEGPDEGLLVRESVVPALPASTIDTLRPGASSRRGEAYKLAARIVVPTEAVVTGKRELQVKVKETVGR